MTDNQTLIERVYQFQRAVKARDNLTAGLIGRAIIPLLNYEGNIQEITKEQLSSIKGIGEKSAHYILRVISGEDMQKIIASIPYYERNTDNPRAKCGCLETRENARDK